MKNSDKSPYDGKILGFVILDIVFAVVVISAIAIIVRGAYIPKGISVLMFFGGGAGMALCFVLTAKNTFLKYKYLKNEKVNKKNAAEWKVYLSDKLAELKNYNLRPQDKEEDVIRIPIEYDDEEGANELEKHTEKFLKDLVYPEGFEDFLKGFASGENDKRFLINDRNEYDDDLYYYEIADVYPLDEIKQLNLDFFVFCDDYHTQFRDVLAFADDESGHCHFILDYGKGGEPTVKYLDDEGDIVILLENTFKEFVSKLVGEDAIKKFD